MGSSCQILSRLKSALYLISPVTRFKKNVSHSNLDGSSAIIRQNRSGSSHHFSYPAPGTVQQHLQQQHHHLLNPHHHFQTMQAQHLISNGGEITMLQPMTSTGSLLLSTTSTSTNGINSNGGTLGGAGASGGNCQQMIPAYMPLLEQQPWFHGKITRKQAESLLENMPIGSFLVRQSESGNLNDFSLSLV